MSPIRVLTVFMVILMAGSAGAQVDGYTCTNAYLNCGNVVESNVITVELQDITGRPGDTVWLPVSLSAVSDTIEAFMILISWDDTYLQPITLVGDSVFLEFELAGAFASVADDFFVQLSQNSADEGAIAAFFNLSMPSTPSVMPPGDYGVMFSVGFVVKPGAGPGASSVFGFHQVNEYFVTDSTLMEAFCADCRRTNMATKYDCEILVFDTILTDPLVIDTLVDTVSCSAVIYPATTESYFGSPVAWVDPPISYTGDHCDLVVLDYEAASSESSVLTFTNEGAFGSVTPTGNNTCQFIYQPVLADVGATLVAVIGASDGVNPMVTTETNLNFTNQAPTIVCGGGVVIGAGNTGSASFTVDDVDCDPSTVSICGINPTPFGSIYLDGNEVVFETEPEDAMFGSVFVVDLCVTDGVDGTTCSVEFSLGCCGAFEVQIEKTHGTIQGTHEIVDVVQTKGSEDMGGWNFMIAYDASALNFQAAIPGAFHTTCGWEYFNYRFGPNGNCGNACPSGLLEVLALAETNNGPNHPLCLSLPLPAVLLSLDFLVSNDRTLECQYVPIRFYWTNCTDNSIAYHPADSPLSAVLGVSRRVYDFDLIGRIEDMYTGYPTYTGFQAECLDGADPDKPTPIQFVDFYNGGIDIVCADSIDDRGDINLNGVVNEVADAVLFSNYFVHGISVFNVNIDGQIAASDVNADGITLSVADLVYQIRIITGDAPPYPKVGVEAAAYTYENGAMSVDARMAAAFVVLEGKVNPTLLAMNMEMSYAFDGHNTRVLVSRIERGAGFEGDFLAFDANIVKVEFATYDGAPVITKPIPSDYRLFQNYPNPFNPKTTISFGLAHGGDYSLSIYNVTGQKVASFEGSAEAGTVSIDWDGSEQASGVYFYKLDTDSFTDTKKMVLLK